MGIFNFLLKLFFVGALYHPNCNADTLTERINYNLDDSVIPLHYNLEFAPYLMANEFPEKEQFKFDGKAEIQINTTESNVKEFHLHGTNLKIHKAQLKPMVGNSELIPVTFSVPDPKTDKFTVKLRNPMTLGTTYVLSFEFVGEINKDSKEGFYRYKRNQRTWLLSTNFKPSSARKAFPCFDEPKFKATFRLKVNHHKKYTAYSNTEIEETKNLEKNRALDIFKPTARMSPHNLVLHFSNVRPYKKSDTMAFMVESKYRPEVDQSLFPTISAFLKAFDDYTGFPRNSAPNVEKFNVFRENSADNSHSTGQLLFLGPSYFDCDEYCLNFTRKFLVSYLAEELAEFWFGNIVTCERWTYEWLDVGLSTHLKRHVCDMIHAECHVNERVETSTETAFNHEDNDLDGTELFMLTDESQEYMDKKKVVRYSLKSYKGPAILTMIESMLGYEKFRAAISQYIKNNAYGSVTPDDLMNAFKAQWDNPEVDFEAFFKGWTTTIGYPLVEIVLAKDGKSFTATQKQIFPHDTEWIIPVTYITSNEKNFKKNTADFYLNGSQPVTIRLDKIADWIFGNVGRSGYYRVNYDSETWKRIAKTLKQKDFGGFDKFSRSQILSDLYKFGTENILDYKIIFDVIDFARHETNIENWRYTTYILEQASRNLNRKEYAAFGRYIEYFMSPKTDKLQNGYMHLSYGMMNSIYSNMCFYGDKTCIKEATDFVDSYFEGNYEDIDEKMRFAFAVAVYHQSDKYFDKIFNVLKEKDPENLYEIHCPSSKDKLDILLNYMMDNLDINDNIKQLNSVLFSKCRTDNTIFNYVVENFDRLLNYSNVENFKYFPSNMAHVVSSDSQMQIFVECLDKANRKLNFDQKTYDNYMRMARENLKIFTNLKYKSIIAYLKENYGLTS